MLDAGTLKEYLEHNLTVERFNHSLRVAQISEKLALRYDVDPGKAYFAGLAHDLAKEIGAVQLLKKAEESGKIIDAVERKAPDLLHGPVGAFMLKKQFGVQDESILRAVAHHTTAAPGMDHLEQVIYLADFVEEGRTFSGVREIREIAFRSLEEAMLAGIKLSLDKVMGKKRLIHPSSVEAWNWFLGRKCG